MAEIKISIVVPAYNAEKYLERCLTSLLHQDLSSEEYEIIVINDGSVDRTEEILSSYSGRFSNLNYETVPNGGAGEARNSGFRKVKGKYFMYVDADDWIQENILQEIYTSLEKDQLDVLVMDYHHRDDKGELPKDFNILPENVNLSDRVYSGIEFMQKFLPRVVWSNVYRSAFWEGSDLSFLPISHEDEEILPRIFYYARQVRFLPLSFYFYYKNDPSFMMTYDAKACFYMLDAMESLDAFRKKQVKPGEELDLFFKNLTAKRLLTTFRRSIRWGMPAEVQREMILRMKKRGLTPISKEKGFIYAFLYHYFPSLFIAYYRTKEKSS